MGYPRKTAYLVASFAKTQSQMKHLSERQRYEIYGLIQAGFNQKEIAARLQVHPSTISREIKRNGYSRYRIYKPKIAQSRAEFRWRNRHLPRRFKEDVKALARELLALDYSPEQIVGYCRRRKLNMVSHETLYQWIWWDKKHGGDLYKHLRHRGRRFAKRGSQRKRRGVITNRVDISLRPKVVEHRKRFGDFEVDTIVGANHSQHILSMNDRATGKYWLRKLKKPTAEVAADEMIGILNDLASMGLVKTITSDNGLQFAKHNVVSEALDVDFYFAHPYHSWERGSNENTNGLARQYIPKGTDFNEITDDYLEYVERMLNSRPRRRYSFKSPDEMFRSLTGLEGAMYV